MKLPLSHVSEHASNAGNAGYVHAPVVEDSTESRKPGNGFFNISNETFNHRFLLKFLSGK